MTRKPTTNVARSIQQRLLNHARREGLDFSLVLIRYASERLLYRLSVSPHRDRFVLKGAFLLRVWSGSAFRATRDLDLLGHGEDHVDAMVQLFRGICRQAVDPQDGLEFQVDQVRGEEIREELRYRGVRVRLEAALGKARIPLVVDVGFGDVVVPGPQVVKLPTLLDLPSARIAAYSMESVVAEKFEIMTSLDMLNSRMKDFYDLWFLSRRFNFDGPTLADAVAKTFANRETVVEARPLALTEDFSRDTTKQMQWSAFLRKSRIENAPGDLSVVISEIADFIGPVAEAVANRRHFEFVWHAPGRWLPVA